MLSEQEHQTMDKRPVGFAVCGSFCTYWKVTTRQLFSRNFVVKIMKAQFLLWLIAWGDLLDGLIGIFSFGFLRTHIALRAAENYARCMFNFKGYD